MDTIFTSAVIATNNQQSAAAMYSYISQFFSGTVDPTSPHAILIGASIVASFAVWLGIVLEAEKFWSLPTMLVTFGVAIEAICTILLFGFDEGISSYQKSTIEVQNREIIALDKRLAPRELSAKQQAALVLVLQQSQASHIFCPSRQGQKPPHLPAHWTKSLKRQNG